MKKYLTLAVLLNIVIYGGRGTFICDFIDTVEILAEIGEFSGRGTLKTKIEFLTIFINGSSLYLYLKKEGK